MEQIGLIDLHTHTKYSDGGLTPTELVAKAKKIGLKAIAITDHDSVFGIGEALAAGAKWGVEVIPGVELTAHENSDDEFHFLGYFIDYQNPILLEKLAFYQEERQKAARLMVESLQKLGFSLDWETVRKVANSVVIKPHIAYVVIQKMDNQNKLRDNFGKIPTTGEFIQKYLIPGAPAYQTRVTATPREAIDLIHGLGGKVVLAHPCWDCVKIIEGRYIFDDDKIKRLKEMGLDGLEVLAHRDEEGVTKLCIDHFLKVAETLKLKVTGGSDFHGFGSGGKDLGFQDFYLKVPYEVLEDLRK